MAEQIQWLDGRAKDGKSVEKICPKRHITQDQWQSEWNEMFLNDWSEHCYDFISDYECIFKHPVESSKYFYRELWDNLQAAKQQGTCISIVNIAHFTKLPFAREIVESGGFKGGMKKINEDAKGRDVEAKFSWWSPIFFEDDIRRVRDTLGAAIQPFLDDELSDRLHGDGSDQDDEIDSDQDNEESSNQNDEIDQEGSEKDDDDDHHHHQDDDQDALTPLQKQFASSNAFNPNAQLYGSFFVQYNINYLCDRYRFHFGGDHKVQFKILGTFSYKTEVMHAVLICSQEYGNGRFKEYPPVLTPEEDVNNEAVVTRDNNGNWVWKPQATGTVIKRLPDQRISYPKYRRWEHVAFAFHIPKKWGNETLMSVPDLRLNLHYLPS